MDTTSEKIIKICPRYIPMKCPVCNGHTTVNYGRQQCSACQGKGWIGVPVEEEQGEETYDTTK